jgi:hypothetical protein
LHTNLGRYNPGYSHAHDVFHKMSGDDKIRALRGADERNFKNYDVMELGNRKLPYSHAPPVEAATEKDIKSDFEKMGMTYRKAKPEVKKPAVKGMTRPPMFPNLKK